MSVTEITEEGWFSRIAGSIKGIFTGLLLFLFAIPIIFFNECSAVDRAQDLEVGQGAVVKANASKIDSKNEGKLVHLSGAVEVSGKLTDDKFMVSAEVLELARDVEMYQWKENTDKSTTKKAGGKKTTTTKYTYEKAWSSTAIGSSSFKEEGHDNPGALPFESAKFSVKEASLGKYGLSAEIADRVGSLEPYTLKKSDVAKLPESFKLDLHNGSLYQAKKPGKPKIGDVRISYRVRNPTKVSVIAGQYGKALKPFFSESLNDPLVIVADASKSPDEMFADAESASAMWAWILRFVTFLMMFGGLSLVLKPLSVVADVIPFIGSIVGTGTGLVAFLISAPIWFFCVAGAWVVARPLLGIALIVGGIIGVVLLVMSALKNGAKKAVSAVKGS